MENKGMLTISEFGKLAGVSRKTLIYYDKIGLFCPETVDPESGYRYYSYPQLDVISAIYALKEIGTPLKDIKIYLDERTPERLVALFEERKAKIDAEICSLKRISDMMGSRIEMTRASSTIDTGKISVEYMPAERIFISPDISNVDDESIWDIIQEFYEYCALYNISYGYPVGDIVSMESLLRGEWHFPTWYFARLDEPMALPHIGLRPAGYYAVGYIYRNYDSVDELYEQINAYIEENGLVIDGCGYRESILDEIAVQNPDDYLFQVSVKVEKPPEDDKK